MKHLYCGFIAIVGRPSVGKSTLLNRILGKKITITARKVQTTRYRILGIKTLGNTQMIYVDTPGLYRAKKASKERLLNRRMLKISLSALAEVNVVLFMIDIRSWCDDDEWILKVLKNAKRPVILLLNKIDRVKQKAELLSKLNELKKKGDFKALVPISAKNGTNLDSLERETAKFLPESDFLFPKDQITDRDERFLASEIIREKLIRFLGEELPYAVNVEVEKFIEKEKIINIDALIWVEKDSQKAMIIGRSGQKLKVIGTSARKELERLWYKKVFLTLWVKVKRRWSSDQRIVDNLYKF